MGVKAERVPLSGAARYQGNSGDEDTFRPLRPRHILGTARQAALVPSFGPDGGMR